MSSSSISHDNSRGVTTSFEIFVKKDTFKFNAAHFVAYKGFRERLHGHNYNVAVRLLGNGKIGADGYVLDFGCVKEVTKKVCKKLNEHFICPTLSDVLTITVTSNDDNEESVKIVCEDGSVFVFPKGDCAMLPIVHATSEEIAIYVWGQVLNALNAGYLIERGVHSMEITISEAVGQDAVFRMEIPRDDDPIRESVFDVASYITTGDIVPMPCPTDTERANKKKRKRSHSGGECSDGCKQCKDVFSGKLKALAEAINSGKLFKSTDGASISVEELEMAANAEFAPT